MAYVIEGTNRVCINGHEYSRFYQGFTAYCVDGEITFVLSQAAKWCGITVDELDEIDWEYRYLWNN